MLNAELSWNMYLFNSSVAEHSDHNLMQASNLGVVLGPTLMRPQEETMAAIMNIKYQSVVIETMIKEYDQVLYNFYGYRGSLFWLKPNFMQRSRLCPL